MPLCRTFMTMLMWMMEILTLHLFVSMFCRQSTRAFKYGTDWIGLSTVEYAILKE